jgi:hypothetical protein
MMLMKHHNDVDGIMVFESVPLTFGSNTGLNKV